LDRTLLRFLESPDIASLAARAGASGLLRRAVPRARGHAGRRGRRWLELDLALAERELVRVQRRERSRLLRSAARLVSAGTARDPRVAVEPDPRGRVLALEAWRREAVHALLAAVADDLDPLAPADFLPWLLRDPGEWPAAAELAEASLLGDDCEEGRLLLAREHLAAGNVREAARVLSRAMRRGATPGNRWRLFSNLAVAHEECGGDRLALEALRVATADRACSVGPRVSAFFLALDLGDCVLADRVAEGLREHAGSRSRLREACDHRRRRLLRERRSSWEPSSEPARERFDAWRRAPGDGPVESLCRALSGEGGR
jgi:hypothetical protein